MDCHLVIQTEVAVHVVIPDVAVDTQKCGFCVSTHYARAPALDRKVPVTQTLSFCQMHFLSPLPVAFDRKLVSVIPVTVECLSRAQTPKRDPMIPP